MRAGRALRRIIMDRIIDVVPDLDGKVYDRAAEDTAYPYVTLGPSFWVDDSAECIQARSQTVQVDVWHSGAAKGVLEDVLAGNVRWAIRRSKAESVTDLRLSDHLVGGSLDPDADYQEVLLFAARREKAAHDFYQAMGELIEDKLTQNLFEMLAQEELRHKYVLEKTYEEVVYKDF